MPIIFPMNQWDIFTRLKDPLAHLGWSKSRSFDATVRIETAITEDPEKKKRFRTWTSLHYHHAYFERHFRASKKSSMQFSCQTSYGSAINYPLAYGTCDLNAQTFTYLHQVLWLQLCLLPCYTYTYHYKTQLLKLYTHRYVYIIYLKIAFSIIYIYLQYLHAWTCVEFYMTRCFTVSRTTQIPALLSVAELKECLGCRELPWKSPGWGSGCTQF